MVNTNDCVSERVLTINQFPFLIILKSILSLILSKWFRYSYVLMIYFWFTLLPYKNYKKITARITATARTNESNSKIAKRERKPEYRPITVPRGAKPCSSTPRPAPLYIFFSIYISPLLLSSGHPRITIDDSKYLSR